MSSRRVCCRSRGTRETFPPYTSLGCRGTTRLHPVDRKAAVSGPDAAAYSLEATAPDANCRLDVRDSMASLPKGPPARSIHPMPNLISRLLVVLLGLTAGCGTADKTGHSPAVPRSREPAAQTSQDPQVASFLKVHNEARKAVGVPPLKWSPDLATYAQAWANHLASGGGTLVHRTGSPYGENLAGGRGGAASPTRAAEYWLSERNDYRHGPFGTQAEAVGHYTAMVWQTTTHVGFGTAVSENGTWVVVANYSPAGNVVGQYPYP